MCLIILSYVLKTDEISSQYPINSSYTQTTMSRFSVKKSCSTQEHRTLSGFNLDRLSINYWLVEESGVQQDST